MQDIDSAEYKFIEQLSIKQMLSLYVDDFVQTIAFQDVLQYIKWVGGELANCKEDDFMRLAMKLQERSAQYIIMAMHFCGFSFKSYMSLLPANAKINALINLCKPDYVDPPWKKPSYDQIVAEHIKSQPGSAGGGRHPSVVHRTHSSRKHKCAFSHNSMHPDHNKTAQRS